MKPIKLFNLKSAALLMGTRARQVVQFVNAMLNFKVSVGNKSELIVSDQNATLVLGRGLFRMAAGNPSSSTSSNSPFAILTPNNGTANFNIVQVNNGLTMVRTRQDVAPFVLTEYGGETIIGNFQLGGANADITLPASDGAYYVWGTFNPSGNGGNGSVTVRIGATAAGAFPSADPMPWYQFPNEDSFHFIIGAISVSAGEQIVTVTVQSLDSNHRHLYDSIAWRAMVFTGLYSSSFTGYVQYQAVVIGSAADFGTKGLYIYAPGGVGPGGLWTKLADLT